MEAKDNPKHDLRATIEPKPELEPALPSPDDAAIKHSACDDDCCAICLVTPILDVCHVQPCGHRLGCWPCVNPGLFILQQCWLCREPVACVVRESTGDMFTVPPRLEPITDIWEWSDPPPTQDTVTAQTTITPQLRTVTSFERQVLRRMHVYHHQLFSRHVGANRASGYREITPQVFRNDTALQARARAFLRRELRVFAHMSMDPYRRAARLPENDPTTVHNVERHVRFFICMLKQVDLKGSSGAAERHVRQRLASALSNMRDSRRVVDLFIHELRAFLMSPHARLGEWDASVQYAEPPSGRAPVPLNDEEDRNLTTPFEGPLPPQETARRRRAAQVALRREDYSSPLTLEESVSFPERALQLRTAEVPNFMGREEWRNLRAAYPELGSFRQTPHRGHGAQLAAGAETPASNPRGMIALTDLSYPWEDNRERGARLE